MPFGKTVVETNRGLTVTIESSPSSSPEKASLNRGWIDQDPSAEAFPFPDIIPQPSFTSVTLADGKSTKTAMPLLGGPNSRPIVKGTQGANESFERMQRALALPPCTWMSLTFLETPTDLILQCPIVLMLQQLQLHRSQSPASKPSRPTLRRQAN